MAPVSKLYENTVLLSGLFYTRVDLLSFHRGKGEIVCIRELFTGEARHAHVEAETDMHLWVLNRQQIDNISQTDPE